MVSIPQAVSTVATDGVEPDEGDDIPAVSIPQAVSTVATASRFDVADISLMTGVSIPQAVSTVATIGLNIKPRWRRSLFQYRKR